MRAATTGERGFRSFLVDVVLPTRAAPVRYRYRAKPHHVWIPKDMEDELDKVVEDLDKRFEHWNFRRVDLGANHFKFIYDGLREKTLENVRTISKDSVEVI